MNITGRLTKNAQVCTTAQNKQVVNFSVAVNDSYRNKQGERIEQTTYFDCSYWISPNVAKILTKGAIVELLGRVTAKAWTASNGEIKAGLNFNASQIKLHGSFKKSQTAENSAEPQNGNVPPEQPKDDLPF